MLSSEILILTSQVQVTSGTIYRGTAALMHKGMCLQLPAKLNPSLISNTSELFSSSFRRTENLERVWSTLHNNLRAHVKTHGITSIQYVDHFI